MSDVPKDWHRMSAEEKIAWLDSHMDKDEEDRDADEEDEEWERSEKDKGHDKEGGE